MRFLPGGLLIVALLITGCTSSAVAPAVATATAAATSAVNSANAAAASKPGHVVSEAEAAAARANAGKPRIVISEAFGAELAYAYNPDTPPPARSQRIPPRPSAKAVWHPPHWFWAVYRWLWISGFWK